MPFVHIKSRASDAPKDPARALELISADLAEDLAMDLVHFTVTWETLPGGHYAHAGSAAETGSGHPLLVDLLVPDLNPPERVGAMVRAAAEAIARRCDVPCERVFVNARYARSGMVFDEGDLARW